MIRVVSWNIFKKWRPWHELVEMARRGEADLALLQEAGNPPPDLAHPVPYGSDEFWRHEQYEGRPLYDRWPLVVKLSDRVDVEWFRAVPPISELGAHDIAVSGIGTIAAGRRTKRSSRSPCMRGTSSRTRRQARRGGSARPTCRHTASSRTSRPSLATRTRPGTAFSQPAI